MIGHVAEDHLPAMVMVMDGFDGLFRSKAAWIMVSSHGTKSDAMSTTLLTNV